MQNLYETQRLYLKLSDPDMASAILAYYLKNRDFLSSFEPKREACFYEEAYQRALLEEDASNARLKRGFRFWLSLKSDPDRIMGMAALNNIVWGAFQSCFLGYKLDGSHLRRGYMTEAIEKLVEIGFKEIGLHRIEANVMPRNKASLGVCEKAGFIYEGLSREYLNINGVWEDHVHMVRLNKD